MSELRQDLVSKDWIIVAPGRASRFQNFIAKKKPRRPASKRNCPFENLDKSGNWPPILSYPNEKNWQIAVIPNKYPAVVHHQACTTPYHSGPYAWVAGIGHHDLVITRDHNKTFADLSLQEALQVFLILQKRFLTLAADRCLVYTAAFFNWGVRAGASIYHPHYQVLTLPIIPPDIYHSLQGAANYFKKYRKCVHCAMLSYEKKEKKRIIVMNSGGLAIAPFVSRQPFEVRVFPQKHLPSFERTPLPDLKKIVIVLRQALRKIKKHLHDPDLNFFIHTAPLKNQKTYRHYHWHIEIIPKITIRAGFELSTGVEINVINPDQAAAILRVR